MCLNREREREMAHYLTPLNRLYNTSLVNLLNISFKDQNALVALIILIVKQDQFPKYISKDFVNIKDLYCLSLGLLCKLHLSLKE